MYPSIRNIHMSILYFISRGLYCRRLQSLLEKVLLIFCHPPLVTVGIFISSYYDCVYIVNNGISRRGEGGEREGKQKEEKGRITKMRKKREGEGVHTPPLQGDYLKGVEVWLGCDTRPPQSQG